MHLFFHARLDVNKWVPLEQKMKVGRRKPGVVYYRGRIYVVGGMGKDKDLNCVQVLNPVTEEWENDDDDDAQEGGLISTENNKSHKTNGFVYVPPLQELCGKQFNLNTKQFGTRRYLPLPN